MIGKKLIKAVLLGEKPVQELEDAVISSVPIREMAAVYTQHLLQTNEDMARIDVTPGQYQWLVSRFRIKEPVDSSIVRKPGRPKKIIKND